MYECVFCSHTNISYWRKHKPILKGVNGVEIVSKIKLKKRKNNRGWREKQTVLHSISPTRDTEIIVFTENTQYSRCTKQYINHWIINTDHIKLSCVQTGILKTQAAVLRPWASSSSDRTKACFEHMIVNQADCDWKLLNQNTEPKHVTHTAAALSFPWTFSNSCFKPKKKTPSSSGQ